MLKIDWNQPAAAGELARQLDRRDQIAVWLS
jgi:hypothetical protein